jgi:NAD(P)-dependent dehydrogenase (short-subunit alcohol dehydrogenase family)
MDSFSLVDTITDAEWDHVIAVNLTAPIKMMRDVLPFLQARKHGCIVNVSSKAGVSGAAAGIAYTASKHGLVSIFVRSWENLLIAFEFCMD